MEHPDSYFHGAHANLDLLEATAIRRAEEVDEKAAGPGLGLCGKLPLP